MRVRLGDVIKIESSSKKTVGDKFWLLNLDMVEQQTGRVIAYNYVPREALNGSIIQFDADCVLYSKLRPNLNKVVLPKEGGYATSEMLPLKPDTRVLSKEYLAIFLRSSAFVKWAESKTAGAKMPRLGTQVFLNKEITIPSLPEQEQISNQFAKLDEIVNLRKEQLSKLDELVKSRFVEMFIGKGFLIKTVDEITLGKGEYGAQSASTEYDSSRPRYVRITDINDDGTLNDDVVASINLDDDEQYQLEYGDFLFARMGATVGKTYAFITGNQIFAGYLIRYKLNLKLINPRYLFWYTKLDEYWNWVSLNQSGAAQPGINAKKYSSLQIPLPPLELQEQFAAFVAQVDKSKLAVKKSLEELEMLKKSLMQKYFG